MIKPVKMFAVDGTIYTPPYYEVGVKFKNQPFVLFGNELFELQQDLTYKEVPKAKIYHTKILYVVERDANHN